MHVDTKEGKDRLRIATLLTLMRVFAEFLKIARTVFVLSITLYVIK